jgi:hypothetical protein
MLAVGGRASIGLLVVPAAISTFVARWRRRLGSR